jgi:TetR/AcrR family transcriptional regulator, cholesterol catabolism regulator
MATEETGLRDTILDKAKNLFIKHGYHALSMREIAEEVGVSKAALYYHFKDKEELFIAVLNQNLENTGQEIDAIRSSSTSSSEMIVKFIEYVLAQPAEQRAVIRLGTQEMSQLSVESRRLFNETYHQKFIGQVEEIIHSGMQNGEFKSMDSDIATWALLGQLYPYLYPSSTGSSTLSREKIDLIISLFMDGIREVK